MRKRLTSKKIITLGIICIDRHYNRKHMGLKEIKELSDCSLRDKSLHYEDWHFSINKLFCSFMKIVYL